MAHLRTVVRTPEVPALLSSSLVGRLPTSMASIAVLLLVRGQGGSFTLAGLLTALYTAGTSVGQPTLARIVDRRGQAAVLLGSALVSTAGFVVLALTGTHQPAVSAVAALVAGLGTPPLEPCLRALWPFLIRDEGVLRSAFNLDVGAQEIVFVAGPLITTAAVVAVADVGGVLACALFGLAGTLAFVLTRTSRAWRPVAHEGAAGSPWQQPALVRIFVTVFACALPVGAMAIVAGAFADLHDRAAIIGWALAANALGALVTGLYGAVRPMRTGGPRRLLLAGCALAVGYVPLIAPVPVLPWIALAVVSGAALPIVLSLAFQRVQLLCPPRLLTEANAWVVTAFGVGVSVASFVAGIVTDHLSDAAAIRTVVLGASVVTAAGCLLAAAGRRLASDRVE